MLHHGGSRLVIVGRRTINHLQRAFRNLVLHIPTHALFGVCDCRRVGTRRTFGRGVAADATAIIAGAVIAAMALLLVLQHC